MSDFFLHVKTPDEIRATFNRLAAVHHPGKGGVAATYREVERQYLEALKLADGAEMLKQTGETYAYKYSDTAERTIAEKIDQILSLGIEGVKVMLIGKWVWVDGDTKPRRAALKGAGMKWHSQREKWFWHEGKWHGRRSRGSLESLARKYGLREFGEKVSA